VLRIRHVYPGSRISDPRARIRIFPSRVKKIPDPHQVFLTPKKLFLSSRKYDSSRIRILIFLPIPDPGVIKAPDPGSGSSTLEKSVKINLWPREQDILRDPGLPGPWDPEHLRPTQRCLRSQGIHRDYVGAVRYLYPGFYWTVFQIIFTVYSVLEF
jgi:hypothetical protein